MNGHSEIAIQETNGDEYEYSQKTARDSIDLSRAEELSEHFRELQLSEQRGDIAGS